MKNQEQSSNKVAYLYLIKLLTQRDYSRSKLEAKLTAKGFERDHIQSAIDTVIEKGFLREEDYATARAKVLMEKGLHPEYILEKLSQESIKISSEQISILFDENEISTKKQINDLITKKIRSIDLNVEKAHLAKTENKIIRYVLSKGHDLEDVRLILDKLIQNKTN